MPNTGAVQRCCPSSASGGGEDCMGFKMFCLNLSYCLDVISAPLYEGVCVSQACI